MKYSIFKNSLTKIIFLHPILSQVFNAACTITVTLNS